MKIALDTNAVLGGRLKREAGSRPHRVEMYQYLSLRFLAEAVGDPGHVNFVNVAGL